MQTIVVNSGGKFLSIPAEDFCGSSKNTDCFVPICEYKDLSSRKKENIEVVNYFFHDLDVGKKYKLKTVEEALEFIQSFVTKYVLPKPRIIKSGGGLHVLFPLKTAISLKSWKSLADQRRAVLTSLGFGGVGFDNAKTIDPCAMYRLEGSVNTKYSPPIEVVQIQTEGTSWSAKEWKDFIALHSPVVTPKQPAAVRTPTLLADADKIAVECGQLNAFKNSLGNIPEPLWFNGLGVLANCKDGKTKAHLWSAGYDGYTQAETDSKLERWLEYQPPKCKAFSDLDPTICQDCKHRHIISSPLSLGLDSLVELNVELIPPGYTVTADGVYMDGVLICSTPIYIRDLLATEQNEIVYDVAIRQPSGWIFRQLSSVLLADLQSFRRQLSRFISLPAEPSKGKLLMGYLVSFAESIRKKQIAKSEESPLIISRMGWILDKKAFVLGQNLYQPNEPSQPITIKGTDITAASQLVSRGSVKKWRENLQYFEYATNPPTNVLWFTILAGIFTPPILRYSGYQGAAVHLTGPTATGKSLILKTITSAYGDPELLIGQASDTPLATASRIAFLNSLPYTIDEVTTMNHRVLKQLIFDITSGRSKLRLSHRAETKETTPIRTVLLTSSNISLREFLRTGTAANEAVRTRFLEICTYDFPKIAHKDGIIIANNVNDNIGVMGVAFIQALVNTKNITKKYREVVNRLIINYDFQDKDRFMLNLFACTIVGINIAAKAGLISRPHAMTAVKQGLNYHFRQEYFKYLRDRMEDIDYQENPMDLIMDYIQDSQRSTLVIINQVGSRATQFVEPRSGQTSIVVNKVKKTVFISLKQFKDYCTQRNIEGNLIARALFDKGYTQYVKQKGKLTLPQRPGYTVNGILLDPTNRPLVAPYFDW